MKTNPPTTDKDINEQALETAVRGYIDNSPRYRHGGIVNLLVMIANYCEVRCEVTGCDDWETARQAVDAASTICDLYYREDN